MAAPCAGQPYRWASMVDEPCLMATTDRHRLADRCSVDCDDLLDEPFRALPESGGPLHDELTDCRPPPRPHPDHRRRDHERRPDYESLADGRGVCLLASGDTPLVAPGGVHRRVDDRAWLRVGAGFIFVHRSSGSLLLKGMARPPRVFERSMKKPGSAGIWVRHSDVSPQVAGELERLGCSTLWLGASPPAELEVVDPLLGATETLVVAPAS